MEINGRICAFFGHRKIEEKENLQAEVKKLVEELIIEKGFTVFLFGGFGDFDELCYNAVSIIKEKYPTIKRVYCLTDERHIRKEKRAKIF